MSLLETSRRNNTRTGVTGILLYKDGNFMQLIEGEEAQIHQLQARIGHDSRHKGLLTLLKRQIDQRQFPDWSMGFKNLSDPVLRSVPGYSEFLNTSLTCAEFSSSPSRADKLLRTFKERM